MSHTIRPRRSVLFMPGINLRVLEKAKTLATDCVVMDLEDSVMPDEKATARAQVIDTLERGGYGARELIVRINELSTPWGHDDVKAVARSKAHCMVVPKVSSAQDVAELTQALDDAGAPPELQLWAMIETPMGVLNVHEIAKAAKLPGARLSALVIGSNDLAKETGAHLTKDRLVMMGWMMTCLAAARAYGLTMLDAVYNDFRDLEGFAQECEQGKIMGMDGKSLIHPGQIEISNQAFSPNAEDIERAKEIIAVFELPENSDKGVVTLNGKMVERLHEEMAQRQVAMMAAIEKLTST